MTKVDYKKILPESSSFQLIRTNPKLTGNVKLTVDSSGDLWLNSIEANEELSKNQYKKFPVDISREHGINIYKFFNNGRTPNNIIFDLKKNVKVEQISENFEDQYDFSDYYSGAKFFPSKFYDERFSYLAPLYMKEQLPDYFIIFKVPGPMNYESTISKNKYPHQSDEYLYDMLKGAEVKSVYDLTDKSKLGKYLRSMLEHDRYPKSPLDVNFNNGSLTNYNGISITAGTYASKGEDLSGFYRDDNPIKYFEQFMTLGYERNSILYPYIMNIEFLFDEEFNGDYEFNRYIGVYINKIQLDELEVDLDKIEKDNHKIGNLPKITTTIDENDGDDLTITNTSGVILPISDSSSSLVYSDFTFSKSGTFLTYVEDRDGNLHLPNAADAFSVSSGTLESIRLNDKELNVGKFYGPGDVFLQETGNRLFIKGSSHIEIKFLDDLNDFDKIKIYHTRGSKVDDSGNKYDEFIAMYNSVVSDPGDTYYYYDAIDTNQSPAVNVGDLYYFNGYRGTDGSDSAEAFAFLINKMRNKFFKAYQSGNSVIIKSKNVGNHDSKFSVEVESYSNYDKISVNDITGDTLEDNKINFIGGSSDLNRFKASFTFKDSINDNIEDLLVKTEDGWSGIESVSNYIDIVNDDTYSTKKSSTQALADYNDEIVVTLSDEELPNIKSSKFLIKEKFKPKFGLISIYPVKDFDYDFYSDKYNRFPIWELYKYFYIPPNKSLLNNKYVYKVVGSGVIGWNGNSYTEGQTFTVESSEPDYYTIESGSPFLVYDSTRDDYDLPTLSDKTGISSFTGYYGIRDVYDSGPVDEESETYRKRDRFLRDLINTEYHYYRENYNKDFAFSSKLNPYIFKWGYKGGKDVRDNPYRLNTSRAFGLNNLSPDQTIKNPDPSKITNEWYYLISDYSDFINDDSILAQNYSYFNDDLDLDTLLSDEDEFLKYFLHTPKNGDGDYLNCTQDRYSIIKYNNSSKFNETLFRGVKIRFKDVANNTIFGSDNKPLTKSESRRFDGYRFSVVLNPVKRDINDDVPPVSYKFIEKKDYKFILMVIELSLEDKTQLDVPFEGSPTFDINNVSSLSEFSRIDGDYRIEFNDDDISNMTYLFLYSVADKKFRGDDSLLSYSNVRISGKLDFSDLDSSGSEYYVNLFESDQYSDFNYNILNELSDAGSRNYIVLNKDGTDLFVKTGTGFTDTNALSRIGQSRLFFNNDSLEFYNSADNLIYPIPSQNKRFYQDDAIFKQVGGGRNYYAKLFSKLSLAQIKRYINSYDSIIEYITYDSDNNQTTSEFYAEIIDPSLFGKSNTIISKIDTDIPEQFKSESVISYVFNKVNLASGYDLNRYGGPYEPTFKDVFTFIPEFEFNSTTGLDDIIYANIKLNTKISCFGKINNFWNLKISDRKILKLQNDDKFNPVFELIDEITLDRNDFNVLLSNWEYGFHKKYLTKNTYSNVHGFLRVGEDYNFTSKILNIPDNVTLESFNVSTVDDLDTINIDDYEIVYETRPDRYVGVINLRNVLIRYLKTDGIDEQFKEYIDETFLEKLTIDEYVTEYIKKNILKLYETLNINFYIKKLNDKSSFDIVSLTSSQKDDQEYNLEKNVTINKQDALIYTFTINKDVNKGLSVSPEVKIKYI